MQIKKNNSYQYWREAVISGQFKIRQIIRKNGKISFKTIWKSKNFYTVSIQKPDFKHGRVVMRTPDDLIAQLDEWGKSDKKEIVRSSFSELINLGSKLSYFMNFGATLGILIPDSTYLKAYKSLLDFYVDNSSSVFFEPALYLDNAFRLNDNFFLGFSLTYFYPFDNHTADYSDLRSVHTSAALDGFYPAIYLGLQLHSKQNSLTLLTLEPGVFFGNFYQKITSASIDYETKLSGIGEGVFLGIEYIEHYPDDFNYGKAGFTYSLKLSTGFTYINRFSDASGRSVYIQNNNDVYTLYLADQNTVLPNSKLMEMFNFHIGIQAAIGFGL